MAALASVPAVFLTLFDGVFETVGTVVNQVSGLVLITETVVLAVLARDKRAWLTQHKWLLGLTAVLVPAVVFAVGPVQLLRLVRLYGALRFLRFRRIITAARILRERAGLTGWKARSLAAAAGFLVAGFAAAVLADPTSPSRQLLRGALERLGGTPLFVVAVVTAGALLAVATWIVARSRSHNNNQ